MIHYFWTSVVCEVYLHGSLVQPRVKPEVRLPSWDKWIHLKVVTFDKNLLRKNSKQKTDKIVNMDVKLTWFTNLLV